MLNIQPGIYFHFLERCNLQERSKLKEFIASMFRKEKKSLRRLDYIFCTDDYLLSLNRDFLKHDYFTDIITFDLSETDQIVGEVYISIDRVKDNAVSLENTFRQELLRVIFHGALHLCGFKDKKPKDIKLMRQKEEFYLGLHSKA